MDKNLVYSGMKMLVLGSCAFMGGYVANLGPRPAHAQIRTLPPQGNPRIQQGVTDTFIVPNSGVRFVSVDGKPVMVVATRGNDSILALFDSGGQPTITLTAGSNGTVNISTSGSGAQISAVSASRSNQVGLLANDQGTQLAMSRSGHNGVLVKDDVANGSRLTLASRAGKTALDVFFGNNRGSLSMYDDNGQSLAAIGYQGTSGSLELKDSKKKSTSQVTGEGKVTLTEGEKTLWSAPPVDK
ncbi:MAG: WD40 repeat domain-containing protein [Armatimonadetes bacterium]|nr:WD40 repeat domain-containing protein [Armatimonadota bacterium]